MSEVMTATRPVPRTAAAGSRRLFTREEYQAMGQAGILDEDERVELLGGEIIVMSGIREVWIVDLEHDRIESYREPAEGRYQVTRRYEPGEALTPAALPDLRLDVASLVPARSRS